MKSACYHKLYGEKPFFAYWKEFPKLCSSGAGKAYFLGSQQVLLKVP